MGNDRVVIAGSAPQHEGSTQLGALSRDQNLTVSIVLRRRPDGANTAELLLSGQAKPLSREEALQQTAADPQELAAVEAFARDYCLRVLEADAAKRIVKVSGSVQEFERAFGVQIGMFGNYVSYGGPITVPEALAGVIVAVLGLDNRPVARARSAGSDQ